ncbi:MAG: hypothetical protein OQK78_05885 [Gammaproteobacteria bacterium]|nr:hypothetical protein [Gammaproteobacteria bacterium]
MPIKYEGFFDKKNQPTSGNYVIEFKGRKYNTRYHDGLPTEGAKLYTNLSYQADIFVGEFKEYKDPYSKSRVAIPYKGEYTDHNGFKYTGTFISFPSMGMYAELYKKYPTARRSPFANVVFVGTISYKGQKEVGIYVKESYLIGSQLSHFEPTDETAIKGLERKFKHEYSSHQSRLASAERAKRKSNVNWGKVFALAAGAAMVKNSNMDIDSQSQFIDAYVSDVMNGTTSNLSSLSKSMSNGQSTDEIFRQSYKNAQEISKKYNSKKYTKPTLYEQNLARIKRENRQAQVDSSIKYQQQGQSAGRSGNAPQRSSSGIKKQYPYTAPQTSTGSGRSMNQGTKQPSSYNNSSTSYRSGTSTAGSPVSRSNRTVTASSTSAFSSQAAGNQGAKQCDVFTPPLSSHPLPILTSKGVDHLRDDGAVPTLLRRANEHMESTCGNKNFRIDGQSQPTWNREITEKRRFFNRVELTLKAGQVFSCLCTPPKSEKRPGRGVAR